MSGPAQYGNWLGVLKWSLRYSDGTAPSDVKPMSEEDREFLQKVFDEMSVDENKRMVDLMNVVTQPAAEASGSDDERFTAKINALEEVIDIVSSIDNAKNMFVIGAYDPLLKAIASPADVLGMASAVHQLQLANKVTEVLTTVVQNNPKAQGWALDKGTFPVLVSALAGVSAGANATYSADISSVDLPHMLTLQAGLITALSALVRDNAAGQALMVKESAVSSEEGSAPVAPVSLILSPVRLFPQLCHPSDAPAAIKTRGRRLVRKALFFIRHLVKGTSDEQIKNYLVESGGWEQILSVVASLPSSPEDDDTDSRDARQSAIAVLLALFSKPEGAISVVDDSDSRRLGPDGRGHMVLPVGQPAQALSLGDEHDTAAPIALLTAGPSTTPIESRPVKLPMTLADRAKAILISHPELQREITTYHSWCTSMIGKCEESLEESTRDEKALYVDERSSVEPLLQRVRVAVTALQAAARQ